MTFSQFFGSAAEFVDYIKAQELTTNETIFFVALAICISFVVLAISLFTIRLLYLLVSWPFRAITIRTKDRYSDQVLDRLAQFEKQFASGLESILAHECEQLIAGMVPSLESLSGTKTREVIDAGLAKIVSMHMPSLELSSEYLKGLSARIQDRCSKQLATTDSALNQKIDSELLEWVSVIFSDYPEKFETRLNKELSDQIIARAEKLAKENDSAMLLEIDIEVRKWAEEIFSECPDDFKSNLNAALASHILACAETLIQKNDSLVQGEIAIGLTAWAESMFTDYPEYFEDKLCGVFGEQIVDQATGLAAVPESNLKKEIGLKLLDWLVENGEEIVNDNSSEISMAIANALPDQVTASMGNASNPLRSAVASYLEAKLES